MDGGWQGMPAKQQQKGQRYLTRLRIIIQFDRLGLNGHGVAAVANPLLHAGASRSYNVFLWPQKCFADCIESHLVRLPLFLTFHLQPTCC